MNTIPQPPTRAPPSMTNGFTTGPKFKPLSSLGQYNSTVITAYISTVLSQIKQNDSYGILVGIETPNERIVPTFVFGFPGEEISQTVLQSTPYDLPLLLLKDSIVFLNNTFDTPWSTTKISDFAQLTLEKLSLGIEGLSTLLQHK